MYVKSVNLSPFGSLIATYVSFWTSVEERNGKEKSLNRKLNFSDICHVNLYKLVITNIHLMWWTFHIKKNLCFYIFVRMSSDCFFLLWPYTTTMSLRSTSSNCYAFKVLYYFSFSSFLGNVTCYVPNVDGNDNWPVLCHCVRGKVPKLENDNSVHDCLPRRMAR